LLGIDRKHLISGLCLRVSCWAHRNSLGGQCLCWLGDGKQIVSGGGDHSIRRLWQVPDQAASDITLVKEIKGHDGSVTSLEVSASSNQLFSGSSDGSVRLWNVESGELLRKMEHAGAVSAVAVRSDGKKFASAGSNLAKLWDAEGKLIAELKGDRYAQEAVPKQERALSFAKSEVAYRKGALESAQKEQKAETDRVAKSLETRVTAEKNLTEKQKAVLSAVEARAVAEKALTELSAGLQKITEARDAAQGLANQADAEAKSASERATHKANAEKAVQVRAETEKLSSDDDKTKAKLLADTKAVVEQLAADTSAVAADAKIIADRLTAEAAAKSKVAAEARTAAEKAIAELPEKQKLATEKINATLKALADAEKEVKQTEIAKSVAEDQLQAAQASGKKAADAVPLAKAAIEVAEEQQRKAETSLDVARKASADSEKPIRTIAFSPDNLTIATAGDDEEVHTWNAENGVRSRPSRVTKDPY
jgi:WD40 repeat protein